MATIPMRPIGAVTTLNRSILQPERRLDFQIVLTIEPLIGRFLSEISQYAARCFGGIRIRRQPMAGVDVILNVLC
jgi:hypothetical protein